MEVTKKSESYAHAFKNLSFLSLFYGVFMVLKSFVFSSAVTEMVSGIGTKGGGVEIFVFILVLALSLLVPIMLVLAGIFGYLKKPTAVIVFSVIAAVVSIFSFISNMSILATTTDGKGIPENIVFTLPYIAIPILFIIYGVLIKKNSQKKSA